MNDQYRYFEQHLTPRIAQELIQELFTGQTVQKQEIVRGVDETHHERGGSPSNLQGSHPVTAALTAMKKSGLAENPRRGVWNIFPVGKHYITTLNSFLEWTKEFRLGVPGDYVFRGVPNQKYRIEASAYRRPKEENRSFKKFLRTNEDLIEEAKLRGYNRGYTERNGQELKDLEILAELQHFGAATCLIDFTHNALIALWFACQPDSKTAPDSPPPDGKVFAVYNQSPKFEEIKSDSLKQQIDQFLQDGESTQLYHWEPRQRQNNRIIAQQSIFLFGHYTFDADEECVVPQNSKKNILRELKQLSGITEAMLFPDFDGFARLRGEGKPYTQLSASEYMELANKQSENHNYEAVIAFCNRALDDDPDYAEAHYLHGYANHHLGRYESAISDFDIFIERNPDYAEAHYYRGEAYSHLHRLAEARTDLQLALDLAVQDDNEELIGLIQDMLYEINSRTIGGGSQNE